jgi:septum formation protein
VRFRTLAPADVHRYVATGEWRGRAGGYAIQGRGAALVEEIEGDYWAVVGLPVAEIARLAPHLLGLEPG